MQQMIEKKRTKDLVTSSCFCCFEFLLLLPVEHDFLETIQPEVRCAFDAVKNNAKTLPFHEVVHCTKWHLSVHEQGLVHLFEMINVYPQFCRNNRLLISPMIPTTSKD